jgi:hypothetical protein
LSSLKLSAQHRKRQNGNGRRRKKKKGMSNENGMRFQVKCCVFYMFNFPVRGTIERQKVSRGIPWKLSVFEKSCPPHLGGNSNGRRGHQIIKEE